MILTAEEYVLATMQGADLQEIESALIGFAKLHVKAALKAASEQADMKDDWNNQRGTIDKDSILNAYSLENIK